MNKDDAEFFKFIVFLGIVALLFAIVNGFNACTNKASAIKNCSESCATHMLSYDSQTGKCECAP